MSNEIFQQAAEWLDAGEPVALATIVRIFGSSSQPLGARMAMTTGNRFVGAVSGGCVETDVYETSQVVLRRGAALMLHYQQVEDPLVEIGLNCEGKIDVLVEPLTPEILLLHTAPEPSRRVNVTVCSPGTPAAPDARHAQVWEDGEASTPLPEPLLRDALAALRDDRPVTASYPDGQVALFEPVLPPPTLLIFGADQAAVPLVRFARLLGFRTVVTDGRSAFATRAKHPDADLVLAAWPDEVIRRAGVDDRTYIVSLNHEPRFEDALLHALAGRRVAYIGAIGKRARHHERVERAAAAGLDLDQFPPIHTPIGLDIGGKSPEEVALSIMAEIIAVKNRRPGGMLVEQAAAHMTRS
ncbi:MAG TPA: XdhC family protein [Aggregatilineaceae bacterium]|jgi:xanthine dehydrogenase accessory factor|nr:XdhC family protein [Aggregatilineaceae bacterium]